MQAAQRQKLIWIEQYSDVEKTCKKMTQSDNIVFLNLIIFGP